MTLPSTPDRQEPIHKPATQPCSDPQHSAAFIFVHGLGDSAEGLESMLQSRQRRACELLTLVVLDVADQFQNNEKLPYMHWIIPNAKENRDTMSQAWYLPSGFARYPDRPELEDEEDEKGLMETVAYLESLIDACGNKGIPPERVVLGGFSQGCAVSLLLDLVSAKYAGKLAGVIGLMGYLPLARKKRLQDLRAHAGLPVAHGEVPIFLARGAKDQLVPRRIWQEMLQGLQEIGANDGAVEAHEYEDLGHGLNGRLLMDMCIFLERILPKMED